jgi:flagellar export protein FliJ
MARFIFKLQGVLRQRKQIEQERLRDLAKTAQQMREVEQLLRSLNMELVSNTQSLRDGHLVGRLDMTYLAAHRRYTIAMQRKGQALVQRLASLQKQTEIQQQALAEAAKRRKAIENLKERRHEQWRTDLSRKEMAEMDDISNQMFFRSQSIDPLVLRAEIETAQDADPAASEAVTENAV